MKKQTEQANFWEPDERLVEDWNPNGRTIEGFCRDDGSCYYCGSWECFKQDEKACDGWWQDPDNVYVLPAPMRQVQKGPLTKEEKEFIIHSIDWNQPSEAITIKLARYDRRSRILVERFRRAQKKKREKARRQKKQSKESQLISEVYKKRDDILKSLGFDSYDQYQKSDLWKKEIRPKVLERDSYTCFKCKKQNSQWRQVHHVEYTEDNLSGKSLEGMLCLCKRCHRKAEYTVTKGGRQRKNSLAYANAYIFGDKKIEKRKNKHKVKINWVREEGGLRFGNKRRTKGKYVPEREYRQERAKKMREERLKRWEEEDKK